MTVSNQQKTLLVMNGGGGSEHDISLISSKYLEQCLKSDTRFQVLDLTIERDGRRTNRAGDLLELRRAGDLVNHTQQTQTKIDLFVPCIHGPPGETGEIQCLYEMMGVPYLGTRPEGHMLCFNKVSTKLWLDALKIPNTPWIFLSTLDPAELKRAHEFFNQHQRVFIKAASQGSSIGCYPCHERDQLDQTLRQAFQYSPYILIEKELEGRELEMSVYEYQGELKTAGPGEIICPKKFYDYEEKYSANSKTQALPRAVVDDRVRQQMSELSLKAFSALKLRHFSRVDFFLTNDGELYLNEINTFPGMTPISLFPQMIETTGLSFNDFICSLAAAELGLTR